MLGNLPTHKLFNDTRKAYTLTQVKRPCSNLSKIYNLNPAKRGVVLVSEVFELYRKDILVFSDRSPKTEEQYTCSLRSILRFAREDISLDELDLDFIRAWKVFLKEGDLDLNQKALAPRTVRGYVICLRAVLGYARNQGYTDVDPENIPTPRRIDRIPNVITPAQVNELLVLIEKTPNCSKLIKARNKAIISTIYGSAFRISELCSLNRDNVKSDVFSIVGKMGKEGIVIIDSRSRKYINEYLEMREDDNEALFINNTDGSRLTPNAVQKLFRRLTAAGMFKKPVHPHTLRHSHATNLLINGCHIYTLMRLMRHSNISTTQVYLHHFDAELVEAHQKFHTI